MPQYTVLLFGPAADAVGADRVCVETDDRCDSAGVKGLIARAFPVLESHLGVGRLAVDQQFVAEDQVLDPGAEIALITMVSGG